MPSSHKTITRVRPYYLKINLEWIISVHCVMVPQCHYSPILPPVLYLLLIVMSKRLRVKIYRYLFLRPTAIVPGLVRYKLSITYRNTTLAIYSYQWEHVSCNMSRNFIESSQNLRYTNFIEQMIGYRQNRYEEYSLPHYDGSPEVLQIAWLSKPTEAQVDW